MKRLIFLLMMPVLCFGQTEEKSDNLENYNSKKLYNNYINIADSMYHLKDFKKSLEFYKKAISLFPNYMYPKDQISVLTKLIEVNNSNSLINEYPEGITEKVYERKNSNGDLIEITVLRIVVTNSKADEYKKISNLIDSTTLFYKNNLLIDSKIWQNETN